jgi:egghead protein (zeste-white 4 protein)
MLEYLWLLWFPSAPIMIYFFIRAIQNHKAYEKKVFAYEPDEAEKIIFQFCSRDAPQIVYDAIKRVHDSCRPLGYEKYQVDLVTDTRIPRKVARRIKAKIVAVPSDYQTNPSVKYKARALQYAVEQRTKQGHVNAKTWIFLLDEESMVTEQTVRAILHYISNKDAKPIAEGGITYPNHFFNNNLFCSMAETLRTYVCYDCVTQMSSGKMPSHMHGSNLLVRSDVEAQVGWAHPKVDASEDQRFGWEATLKLGEGNFDWHGGTIEEQPTRSIRDLLNQRQRWFVGNIHNLQNAKIPTQKKIIISLRWIAWLAGFPAGLSSFLILLIPQAIPNWIQIFLLFNTFTWLIGYQVGLRLNLKKYSLPKHKKVLWHLATLVLTPFVGIVETFGVFIAPLQLRHFVRTPTPKYSRESLADVLKPKRKTAANPEDAPQLVFETPTLQTETEQPQQIPINTPAKPKNSKTRKTGSN